MLPFRASMRLGPCSVSVDAALIVSPMQHIYIYTRTTASRRESRIYTALMLTANVPLHPKMPSTTRNYNYVLIKAYVLLGTGDWSARRSFATAGVVNAALSIAVSYGIVVIADFRSRSSNWRGRRGHGREVGEREKAKRWGEYRWRKSDGTGLWCGGYGTPPECTYALYVPVTLAGK